MPARSKSIHKMAARRVRVESRKPAFFVGRLILFILVGVILVIGWKGFWAWQDRSFALGDRVTVIVATDDPVIYSYNPQNNLLTIIKIPKNTEIDSAAGYGRWLVGSLWKFGIQEERDDLLSRSIQKSLGVPIDGFIDKEGGAIFTPGVRTNLNFFDRLNLLLTVGRVNPIDRREIDLVNAGVLVKKTLADGTEGFVVVIEKATTLLSTLHDDNVFSESKTLRIVNTTTTDGLGKDTFRVVSTLGLRVIAIDTSKEKYEGACKIKAQKKHRESVSLRRLVALFDCDLQDGLEGPVNIEMTLGENFAKIY